VPLFTDFDREIDAFASGCSQDRFKLASGAVMKGDVGRKTPQPEDVVRFVVAGTNVGRRMWDRPLK
jgi:hypothetical protein